MLDITWPTTDPCEPIAWTHTTGLLPWWTPLAAAVARRDLTTDIGRTATVIRRERGRTAYEVVDLEAVWWSPTGTDRGYLDRIAQAALTTAADRGIRIAATAQVRTRRELTTPYDARVEIRFRLDPTSPECPPVTRPH